MGDLTVEAGNDLTWLDATAQSDLVRQGRISPLELLNAAIARIEKLNGELNAVVRQRFEQARAEATADGQAPFRGIPILLKDLLCHTAGDPVYGGMRALRDRDWRAPNHCCTARHGIRREATVAAEPPLDPPGDRGLKPTRARTSLGPEYSEFWGQPTHEHVLTRSVRDTAAVLDVTADAALGDPYAASVTTSSLSQLRPLTRPECSTSCRRCSRPWSPGKSKPGLSVSSNSCLHPYLSR